MTENHEGLVGHFTELRSRVIKGLSVLGTVFVVLLFWQQEVYQMVARPFLAALPEGGSLIATEVAAPWLVPIQMVFYVSLVLAAPYLFHQAWCFVAPGLYESEKKTLWPLTLVSVLLFYLGLAFAYGLVLPMAFSFFVGAAPEGLAVMTDVSHYLQFIFKVLLAFGVAFQMPIVVVGILLLGLSTVKNLTAWRPYVVVFVFVIGMVLTPPDIFSQTLLALPMWLLFEMGLLYAKWRGIGVDVSTSSKE